MSNDTTIPSSPATLVGSPQRATATLLASDLGDQVNLWTDWDHSGGTFPVEYLPEVIAALQAIQTARTESEAKA